MIELIKVSPLLVMDFETGGFDPKINAITEFAGIAINGSTLDEIERYETLVAPYDNELLYDPKALEITNLTMDQIKGGADKKTFNKDFFGFLKRINIYGTSRKHKVILCGHNILFDIGFLQQIFQYHNKQMSDYFAGHIDFYGNFQPYYIDTLTLAFYKWGNDGSMTKHRLTDCVYKIGEEIIDAHRAMSDVVATKSLVVNFLKLLRNESNEGNQTTIKEERFRKTFKFYKMEEKIKDLKVMTLDELKSSTFKDVKDHNVVVETSNEQIIREYISDKENLNRLSELAIQFNTQTRGKWFTLNDLVKKSLPDMKGYISLYLDLLTMTKMAFAKKKGEMIVYKITLNKDQRKKVLQNYINELETNIDLLKKELNELN